MFALTKIPLNSSEPITFFCPVCSTHLSVPANLAGVNGPCPSCRATIQAPYPQPPAPEPPSSEPAQQERQTHQQRQPTPPADLEPQLTYHQPPLPYKPPAPAPQTPAETYEQQPIEAQEPVQQPAVLRAGPRQLPNRSEPVAPVTRHRSGSTGDRRALTTTSGSPPQRTHVNRILRLAAPSLFICLMVGTIFGVKTFLRKDRATAGGGVTASEDKSRITRPEENGDSFASLTSEEENDTLPTEPLKIPTVDQSELELTPEFLPVDGGIAALEILEKFLAMKTLEERMPHLETKRSKEELEASVLNAPLPKVLKITVDIRETNPIEQLTDYYYHVDFDDGSGGKNPQTMLARTRGGSAPVVVVDPFIDLFGGRFARYAESPTEEAGTFQVIISAGAFCYDDVPGADKKYTLKILAREDTKEIAKAYFEKTSKIGYMLEDETSGLAYGQAKACTAFMRWNTEEDPAKPFLEALDMKALNWNP